MLLLVNHTDTDLHVRLALPLNRREATTSVLVRPNVPYDVHRIIGFENLTDVAVMAILRKSIDYVTLRQKGALIAILDNQDIEQQATVDAVEPLQAPAIAPGDTNIPVLVPIAQPLMERLQATYGAGVLEGHQMQDVTERTGNEVIETDDTPAASSKSHDAQDIGLAAGVRANLADVMPNAKWTQEKLQDYAEKKGIDVAGLSKNAILRKLRGVR